MGKKKFHLVSVFVLTTAILSVGWHHYQTQPLFSIATYISSAFDPAKKEVDVQVKALSPEESQQLLGHNLLQQGIQPLQITIQNNSPHEYAINVESVSLNYIDSREVARKIKKLSLPRSIGLKVLGFLFWPFMIPGAIDSIHTFQSHKLLTRDYKAKSVKEEVVPVYSILNRILFVPKVDFPESFTITLWGMKKYETYIFDIATLGMEPSGEEVES